MDNNNVTVISLLHVSPKAGGHMIASEPSPTYFMLCGVARDDHGDDLLSPEAASQAVDAGDVGTLVIHRFHEL